MSLPVGLDRGGHRACRMQHDLAAGRRDLFPVELRDEVGNVTRDDVDHLLRKRFVG